MVPRHRFVRDTYIFLVLCLGLLAVGREKMLRDPGAFWHTTVGEQILRTGSLPTVDSFTYSCERQPWIAQQWLAEIAMALLHRAAGLDGLLLGSCVVLAVTFTLIVRRFLDTGLPPIGCVVLVLLTLGACSYHFLVRPHLLTLLFMLVAYRSLCDVEAGHRAGRSLISLPLLMILWTNFHGGALGGLLTILIVCLGWLLAGTPFQQSDRRMTVLCLGLTAAGCIGAVLVNPYGAALPAQWVALMRSELLPRIIIEHAPLHLPSVEGAMILALALVYLIMLLRAWPTRRSIVWLVPLLWFALALTRVRHGPLFAVTAAIAIADMLPHARIEQLIPWTDFPPFTARIFPRPSPIALYLMILAILGIGLIAQAAGLRVPLVGAGWARVSPDVWPVRSTQRLAAMAEHSDAPLRVYNDMLFGGYLVHASPRLRIAIDDRCELHRDDGLRRYLELRSNPERYEAMTLYDDVHFALVERGSRLDRHLAGSAQWTPICRDPSATLYERVTAAR